MVVGPSEFYLQHPSRRLCAQIDMMKTIVSVAVSTFILSQASATVEAFAGGGFGAPNKNKKSTSRTGTTKQKKKRKGFTADLLSSEVRKQQQGKKDDTEIQLDKWGLPPPTIEDIFPPMPPVTELIPVEPHRDYGTSQIQDALMNHISLDLSRVFDENGVEKTSLASTHGRESMKLRLLHFSPPVLLIDNFFTSEECMKTERVALPEDDNDSEQQLAPVQVGSKTFSPLAQSKRTSTSWFCFYRSVPTLLAKARDVLGIPLDQMEEPQIVRYLPGETFSWHYDEVPRQQLANGGQRLATLLVYLNSPQRGGGTVFRDLKDAKGRQLAVRPKKGSALLFFPAFADGTPDDRTLHQGEEAGDEKRMIQMWIHECSYRAVVPPNNRQQDAVADVDEVSRRLGYL